MSNPNPEPKADANANANANGNVEIGAVEVSQSEERRPSVVGTERDQKLIEEFQAETAPFSQKELQLKQKLEQELAEELKATPIDDTMFKRFIRGYSREAEPEKKTLEMLREALKWRKENKVADILDEKFDNEAEFAKVWPSGIYGQDRFGHPIYVDRIGQVDPAKIFEKFSVEYVQKLHIKTMERLTKEKERISKEKGVTIYKHIAIIDMKGFGMKHMGSSFTTPMKATVHIDQYYYPETLHKLIVVNSSWVFKLAWALVSPWLHPLTRERIKVGSSYLKEFIDESQIPAVLKE